MTPKERTKAFNKIVENAKKEINEGISEGMIK